MTVRPVLAPYACRLCLARVLARPLTATRCESCPTSPCAWPRATKFWGHSQDLNPSCQGSELVASTRCLIVYESGGAREHEARTAPPVAGPEQDSVGHWLLRGGDQWVSFWLSDGTEPGWNWAQTLGLCQQLQEHMGASLPPACPLVQVPCRAGQASK